MTKIFLEPADQYNDALIKNAHPPDWENPKPAARYNLVVLGAGTGGLVAAIGAVGLGAKVALVERHLMGGDCLNVGCVPSKTIIRSSRVLAEAQQAGRYGVRISGAPEVEFGEVMARMRSIRTRISEHDSAKRYTGLGVDVFLGEGHFTKQDVVEVEGKELRFKKAVIATGARPVPPPVEGIEETGYHTNETVFSLTERPQRLAVIGGGPIGCEMAQAFQRLGCRVSLFHRRARILSREDPDAAEILQRVFQREGIQLMLESSPVRISRENGEKVIHYDQRGEEKSIRVDAILVGVGRVPNVEELNLENVGVEYDPKKGVKINDYLQTTNPNIYAVGDVSMKHKFTHAADSAARLVIQNALFFGRKKLSSLTIPWCTYTEPEVAHVGMSEADAKERGIQSRTFVQDFSEVDRAVTDGEEEGFVKVHVQEGSDKIIGATIVGRDAGNMIGEVTLAMVGKMGLKSISSVIHPYPTVAEAIKKVGDSYNRTRLTPFFKWALTRWLSLTR